EGAAGACGAGRGEAHRHQGRSTGHPLLSDSHGSLSVAYAPGGVDIVPKNVGGFARFARARLVCIPLRPAGFLFLVITVRKHEMVRRHAVFRALADELEPVLVV